MIKIFITLIVFVSFGFSSSENVALMNSIKNVIQKEEFIALSINKYIKETAKIPKKSDNTLDWDKLLVDSYLGKNFSKYNPMTQKDIIVKFDSSNNCYIQGAITSLSEYKKEYGFVYHFYINKIFRINTLAPQDTSKDELVKGSLVVYQDIQKQIVSLINKNEYIRLDSSKCPTGNYYYELKNGKLVYKYCKGDTSLEVYQTPPIYLEDWNDLQYIKAKVGDIAYARKNGQWFAYFYQGDLESENKASWRPIESGSILTSQDPNMSIDDRLISYIPDAKDLVIRRDGGCMLANGDIFCWGNNKYKKSGIENYGQIDTGLSPDYVNTPVMLKTQILDTTHNSKRWYNSPYRVKFEKMSMNSTNVCGISPVFDYFQSGEFKKFGGDLFCNGQISSGQFEDLAVDVGQTSILKRHKFFSRGKEDQINNSNEVYLIDIAMVEDTIAVLADNGKIYTFGRNYGGALGINNTDKFYSQLTPVAINKSGQYFKKIFALRDIRGFGAVDEFNNFWYWGERSNGTIYYEPVLLASGKKFNPDMIFVNSSDFVLKGLDNIFYRTKDNLDLISLSSIVPNSALSVAIYDDESANQYYLYVNENMQIHGTNALINCRMPDEVTLCNTAGNNLFAKAFNKLNDTTDVRNGKNYASFANAGIYKLDHVMVESLDNFESVPYHQGWTKKVYSDNNFQNVTSTVNATTAVKTENSPNTSILNITNRVDPTRILGRFLIGYESIEKTYNFGSAYANYDVEVEFDFFEIDSWDMERFQVFLNGQLVAEDAFIHDAHQQWTDTNDSGTYTLNLGTHYNDGIFYVDGEPYSIHNDQKYTYKLKGKLDGTGKIHVLMRVRELRAGEYGYNEWAWGQSLGDESWGIDNVHIKVKETNKKFVCAMTGVGSSSQMYCWGNVARSIPIINTSLYDVSKIATINKLFVTNENDKKLQMSFDEFYNSGKLFLKYPTYIGGFDYEFYFK